MTSEQEIIDAYLRHWRQRDKADAWAHGELGNIVSNNPEKAWTMTVKLIEQA